MWKCEWSWYRITSHSFVWCRPSKKLVREINEPSIQLNFLRISLPIQSLDDSNSSNPYGVLMFKRKVMGNESRWKGSRSICQWLDKRLVEETERKSNDFPANKKGSESTKDEGCRGKEWTESILLPTSIKRTSLYPPYTFLLFEDETSLIFSESWMAYASFSGVIPFSKQRHVVNKTCRVWFFSLFYYITYNWNWTRFQFGSYFSTVQYRG